MIALFCVLLSAISFYVSIGLGEQWALLWFAPVPVLWLAFGRVNSWVVFVAALAGMALGAMNVLKAYAGNVPTPVLLLSIIAPALLFAVAVISARQAFRARGPMMAMLAFGAMWAALDFLTSFDDSGGSITTPAAAEVGAPMLVQAASLVGFVGVTFLVGVVAAGLALSLRTHRLGPAIVAVVLFGANASFGYWRMSAPPTGSVHVALIDSDEAVGQFHKDDKSAAVTAIDRYVDQIDKLRGAGVQLIVLPENIALVGPNWRGEVQTKLASAATLAQATVVAGFNTDRDGAQRNVSWAFAPGQATPITYEKRRLVPGLESRFFTPGPGPLALSNGAGMEICKDMDFQAMLRSDAVATRPAYLAVPAWDFKEDGWYHARVAMLRSVENGEPMARSARDGLLTLNDRYGRMVAVTRTTDAFQTLIGDLPLSGRGGETFYDRHGDIFGWFCVVLGFGLTGLSFVNRKNIRA